LTEKKKDKEHDDIQRIYPEKSLDVKITYDFRFLFIQRILKRIAQCEGAEQKEKLYTKLAPFHIFEKPGRIFRIVVIKKIIGVDKDNHQNRNAAEKIYGFKLHLTILQNRA
jgi:hypothetical protein